MDQNIKHLLENNPDLAAYIQEIESSNEALNQTVKSLDNENQTLSNKNKSLSDQNKTLAYQVETLQFTLSKFNRQLFGKKSEKVTSEEEKNLFNFNEAEQNKNLNAKEPTIEQVEKKRKERKTKTKAFDHLETKEIIYDLEESDKSCDLCESPLVEIGSKTRETIEVIKKAIKVMEKSITYKCPHCDTFHKKDVPHLPIPGSIATPSLLAQVIVDKTANALPLYRQSEDYKRIGLQLSRQTLSNWMIKSSLQLDLIYQEMITDLLSKDVLHADETTLQVLKEDGKKASTKSYMWTYVSSKYDEPIVVYDYQPSRAGKHASAFLKTYKGYLHVDGYQGYNQVQNVTIVHCMAHLRRKFHDIYVTLPEEQQANSHTSLALSYCNNIYAHDKKSRELSVTERHAYKQKYIKPLMIEFKDWLNEKQLTSAQNSNYGKAINYAVTQLPTIMNYLEDGRLELDNNRAERAIKPFVIGRKNWIFSNTPNGANSSAQLYSIVQTCLLNHINPYQYLAHVLDLLANRKINEIKLNEIMPYSETMINQFKMHQEQ